MPVHSIRFRSRPGPPRVAAWALGLLAALAALVLLAAAGLAVFGGNWLRGPVERMAQEKTGRALRIDGDVRIRFGWPLLHVQAGRIAFANADWAKPPDMFTADEADLDVRWPALLLGHVVIDELRLKQAAVALEKDAQGRKNWELPGGPSQVEIRRLGLEDSRVDYQEPARHTSVRASIAAAAGGLALRATGSFDGQPLQATASGGPLLALRDESRPYPLKADLRVGPTHLAVEGSVTGLQDLAAADLKAEADGDSFEQLFPLLGVALPDTKPYRTSGRVVREGKTWRYEKFAMHVGNSDVSGSLRIDTSGSRPLLTGDAVFGTLDVADLGATIGTHRTGNGVLPDSRFNAKRWRSVDADLRLSAREIQRPHGVPLERFATHLVLRDAVLTLDPLEFGIAGGKLSGTVRLDGRQEPIRSSARLKIANIAVDRLVPGFDTSKIDTGRIDGAVDLAGKGDSVAQMLGDADGTVAMLVNGGHVSRLLMEEIGLHIPRIVALKAGGDQRIGIRCAAADFKVSDGVMHTRTGVFDTTVTRVDAGGDIDLKDQTLDLTLNPNTKEPSLVSLHTPIHIRGSFSKPEVKLEKGPIAAKAAGAAALAVANPLLALIPLLETGPGRDSDCGRLLTASPAAADAQKQGVKTPPPRR